jgi:hypothetical protein
MLFQYVVFLLTQDLWLIYFINTYNSNFSPNKKALCEWKFSYFNNTCFKYNADLLINKIVKPFLKKGGENKLKQKG